MDLKQIIAQAGGVDAIAGQLGINSQQAAGGLEALLPAVLGGFKKNAQQHQQGLGGVLESLQGHGGTGLVENVLGAQPTDINAGNNILGQIFGSKDVSHAVATQASAQSGVDASVLKKMLPMVAMLAAGYMSHASGGQQNAQPQAGGLGGLVGGLLGGGQQASGGGLGGLLGGLMGGGGHAGIGAMLDLDGDGNPLDDILGMAGKLGGR